jgi:hypothetical protein
MGLSARQGGRGQSPPRDSAAPRRRTRPASPKTAPAAPTHPAGAAFAFHALTSLLGFCVLYPTDLAPLVPGGVDAEGYYLSRAVGAGLLIQGQCSARARARARRGAARAGLFRFGSAPLLASCKRARGAALWAVAPLAAAARAFPLAGHAASPDSLAVRPTDPSTRPPPTQTPNPTHPPSYPKA